MSTVRMHGSAICLAVPPQLMVRVCAQDAKSVRPCSPPALERCLGGRITDLYNGCGPAYAGTPHPLSVYFGVSFPPHLGRVAVVGNACREQVHTVARVPLDTTKRERSAPSATATRGTSCTTPVVPFPWTDPGTRGATFPLPTLLEPTQTASCAARTSLQQQN